MTSLFAAVFGVFVVLSAAARADGAPPASDPRNLTADQSQALLRSLDAGKPHTIKIVADPDGSEAANYALAIAMRLGLAGWRIEGSEIARLAPPGLGAIRGVALVVRDEKYPPAIAAQLEKALAAAQVAAPLVSRPDMAGDAAMLWVGKRLDSDAAAAP